MRITKITPAKCFECEFDDIATDKSISHRSAMFALLADSPCEVEGYLMGEDTLHTLQIARELGLIISMSRTKCLTAVMPGRECGYLQDY